MSPPESPRGYRLGSVVEPRFSYSHIYDLGRAHGQAGTIARLLPLSVDGLILAASLMLLHEAHNGRWRPALARWMLSLGVGATVAANDPRLDGNRWPLNLRCVGPAWKQTRLASRWPSCGSGPAAAAWTS
jgi:hypothetical protein